MDQAAQRTENAMGRMERSSTAAKEAMIGLAQGAAGALSVGALGALIKGAIDAADNLRDMSQKTGIAVEQLNGLGFAAGNAGGDMASLADGVKDLNKNIALTAGGDKKLVGAFNSIGISVTDANGKIKSAGVVLAEMADKFSGYADGPTKVALAMTLMGEGGLKMIPLLNDGGDAMRENIAYSEQYSNSTTELSNAADNFNDTMGKLTLQQQGFANAMASAVLPILQAVTEEVLGAAEASEKYTLASNIVRTVLETLVVTGSEVAFVFKAVGTEIGGVSAQMAALANFDIKGFNAISKAMKEDAVIASADHDKFIKRILDRTPALVSEDGKPTLKPNAPKPPAAVSATPKKTQSKPAKTDEEKLDDASKSLVAKLNREKGALGLTGAALLSYEMSMDGMSEAYQRQALASQTTIDAWNEETEVEKQRASAQKRASEEAQRATEQNEANVKNIRISLMSESEQETLAHEVILEELRKFGAAKLATEAEINATIEAENARHGQTLNEIQARNDLTALARFGDTSDQMLSIMKAAGQEKTAAAKALFLVTKAIAVAEIIVSTNVAAQKAQNEGGTFAGFALSSIIRASGYANAAMTAGMAIAEASAEGGYDIPAGQNPLTQLHEKEMVLPKQQADVIRGLAENGRSGRSANVTYSPVINIDARTDQAQVHQLVSNAVQQGNAQLVDKLQRAGAI